MPFNRTIYQREWRAKRRERHGEAYYRLRYIDFNMTPHALKNLPKKMTRKEAFEHYSNKLKKVWDDIRL